MKNNDPNYEGKKALLKGFIKPTMGPMQESDIKWAEERAQENPEGFRNSINDIMKELGVKLSDIPKPLQQLVNQQRDLVLDYIKLNHNITDSDKYWVKNLPTEDREAFVNQVINLQEENPELHLSGVINYFYGE